MSREIEGAIDSDIEQQLSDDETLFAKMAAGVEEEEVPVEEPKVEVEEPHVEEVVEVEEPEIEEDDPTNEQVDSDDDDPGTVVEDTPPIKAEKLYTPEEIKELVSTGDFTRIDTSRLSEEGKLVMKSMQSGLTPKLQEAAELRRQIAELSETVQKAIPKPQPKDIFEAHDQDPKGVTDFLNSRVKEAIAGGNSEEIELAKEDRDQVRHYAATKPAEVAPELDASRTAVELLKAVPNINDKQKELREYALEVMGYTEEELEFSTNLQRGPDAVREIIRINNAYEKHMAPRRAKAKRVPKKPTPVEKGGGGFEKPETTSKDRIAHAKKTGDAADWMDVFIHMEE